MSSPLTPAFSLEFFPPRDAAAQQRLVDGAKQMLVIDPHYVSVTFGAGGSTRDGTLDTVRMMRALGRDAAPHLSCIGSTRDELSVLLQRYREEGVRRIVALRGDMPSGMGASAAGALQYASDLVEFIRHETGDWFHIEVAAYPEMHPQAAGPEKDLAHFINKVRAGANSAITQYFFNADAYFDFVDRVQAKGINIPIVPGIMPITNYANLARFSSNCGADIPRWVRQRLQGYGDDADSIREFGIEVVSQLCDALLDGGAPGLHFYTMNQSGPVSAIWHNLGLSAR